MFPDIHKLDCVKPESAPQRTVRLFHRRAEEARPMISALADAGYRVIHHSTVGQGLSTREVAESKAVAFVIDLSRAPSHGRNVGAWLRGSKRTQWIPLIFVGGDPVKVAAIREEIPDADYVSHAKLIPALRRAKTPKNPVAPPRLAPSGRTTAQKLGIKEGMSVRLIDPPGDYARVIGDVPERVEMEEDASAACGLTLGFIHDAGEFEAALPARRRLAVDGPFWMIWQEGRRDGLNGNFVRATALKMGLVDYKICSPDEKWSGMLFAVKKARSGRHAR
jgi:hypothetical protein